jgi:[ribosomal protein S18]-alanine N-acetyltransferase
MPSRFTVRLFRPTDMDQLLRIERASFGADAYDRNLFAEFHHTCGELFLVAGGRGRICGYMVTTMRGRAFPDRAEIVSVAVEPKSRGQGAASSLMRNTLRRLRLRGVTRLSLMVRQSNQGAYRFYERYGFRKLRRVPGYYEDGEDGLLMAATVAPPGDV